MKRILHLILLLIPILIISLSSCNSGKQSSSQQWNAKYKNGRFVKYGKKRPNKSITAFKQKSKSNKKKTKNEIAIEQSEEQIVSDNSASHEDQANLLASNSEDNFEIYLDDKSASEKYSIVDEQVSDEGHATNNERIRNKKPDRNKSTVKNSRKAPKSPQKYSGKTKIDGFGLAGLIAALVGVLIALFTPISAGVAVLIILSVAIAAIVLGIIGLARIRKNPYERTGKGLSIAAIVLGGVLILSTIAGIIIFVLAFGW